MVYVILNPIAGQGQPLRLKSGIEAALKERALPFRILQTERPGHATVLARQAAQDGADVISCGGDGTLCEIIGGLQGSESALFIMPCGTGNDFVKSFFPLPKDPLRALCAQLDGQRVRIDYGRVNESAFLNVGGAGFDVQVLQQAARYKHLGKGLLPYLLGVAAAVRRFKPLKAELTLDGEPVSGEFSIVSIANGQYFGGGMRVAPEAKIDDGLFDVVLVQKVPRWKVVLLMPTFITGHFVRLSITRVRRCREVTLRAQHLTINVDGELRDVPEATFRIAAGALTVGRPADGKN